MPNSPSSTQGFTLIELMVTVAIAAVLLGVATPSFISIISSNKLTGNANQLITSLNLARSEAVKRGQNVVVRKTGDNWEEGWMVFVDIDRSTVAKTDVFNSNNDIEIRSYSALKGAFTLRGNNNFTNFIRYEPDGTSNRQGSFVVCDNADGNDVPEANTSRLIIVNLMGRIRMGVDSNSNGIPEEEGSPVTDIDSCVPPFS